MTYTAEHTITAIQQRTLGHALLQRFPMTAAFSDPREWVHETTYDCEGGRLRVYIAQTPKHYRVRATTHDIHLLHAFGEELDRAIG